MSARADHYSKDDDTVYSKHLRVGRWGEHTAVCVLESLGYTLLERNWRPEAGSEASGCGEIDAVMVDPDNNLVFIEVKTRTSTEYGHALEAIGAAKSRRLRVLAYTWCCCHPNNRYRTLRIDAIAITGNPTSFVWEHVQAVV